MKENNEEQISRREIIKKGAIWIGTGTGIGTSLGLLVRWFMKHDFESFVKKYKPMIGDYKKLGDKTIFVLENYANEDVGKANLQRLDLLVDKMGIDLVGLGGYFDFDTDKDLITRMLEIDKDKTYDINDLGVEVDSDALHFEYKSLDCIFDRLMTDKRFKSVPLDTKETYIKLGLSCSVLSEYNNLIIAVEKTKGTDTGVSLVYDYDRCREMLCKIKAAEKHLDKYNFPKFNSFHFPVMRDSKGKQVVYATYDHGLDYLKEMHDKVEDWIKNQFFDERTKIVANRFMNEMNKGDYKNGVMIIDHHHTRRDVNLQKEFEKNGFSYIVLKLEFK